MFTQFVETPIGLLRLSATDDALCACTRVFDQGTDTPNAVTRQAAAQLDEYFTGTRNAFSVPLIPSGTAFQKRVWEVLLRVDFGETTHYGLLAQRIGNPKASRAVGGAVGKNPLLIFIPCHRVLRAQGLLGGFSAGLDAKEILLRHESIVWKARG